MRRKFVYDEESKQMVEVSTARVSRTGHQLQMDIEPFVSPIDGKLIGSRSQLREHMKRHDVVDRRDYVGIRAKAEADRNARIAGTHPDTIRERRDTVNNAYERVRNEHIARGTWRR